MEHQTRWLRLFDADGRLIPTRAEATEQRLNIEQQRAATAEAEVARLRDEFKKLGDNR